MGAISGDINSLSMYCVDAADLSSRPIASMKSGDRAYVNSLRTASTGARFFLDRISTDAPDGTTVIVALGGVGRWLSEGAFGGLPADIIADSVQATLVAATNFTITGGGGTTYSYQKTVSLTGLGPYALDSFTPSESSIQNVTATVLARTADGLNFFQQDVSACFAVAANGTVTEVGANTLSVAKSSGPNTPGTLAVALNASVGPSGTISLEATGNADADQWFWTAGITRVFYVA